WRLGVGVEAQTHGHARPIRPRLRRELPADARQVDGLPELSFAPLSARLTGARLLRSRERQPDDANGCRQEDQRSNGWHPLHRDLVLPRWLLKRASETGAAAVIIGVHSARRLIPENCRRGSWRGV